MVMKNFRISIGIIFGKILPATLELIKTFSTETEMFLITEESGILGVGSWAKNVLLKCRDQTIANKFSLVKIAMSNL